MIHGTDEQLIERAQRGDRRAAQTLIERYRRVVGGVAYNALGNADDASDVAQETLMYAFQRLTDLRDRSRFAGWLHNITLSCCADYRRRRGTRRLGHFGDPLLGLAMVWVYDCYPFVHTGFVEQFLWRRGVSRREFAPRLAIKALQMIALDLPVVRPEESSYWDGLHGWAEQALGWI